MRYWPMITKAAPKIVPTSQGWSGLGLLPNQPAAEASQKSVKPPQRRLKGTKPQSEEWKMTDGLGMPAQKMRSPGINSDWSFMEAWGSMVGMWNGRALLEM